MAVDVTLMMASVGSVICGSGTSSTRTSRRPCQVSAFMVDPPCTRLSALVPVPSRGNRVGGLRTRTDWLGGLIPLSRGHCARDMSLHDEIFTPREVVDEATVCIAAAAAAGWF